MLLPRALAVPAIASPASENTLPSALDTSLAAQPTGVVEAPEVTHIRYALTGREKLVPDDRGARGELVGPDQPER